MGIFKFLLERKKIVTEARVEKVEARQSGRTDRAESRAGARIAAYQNGIDPNAWIAKGIGSVANAATAILGKGNNNASNNGAVTAGGALTMQATSSGGSKNILLIGGAILSAILIMFKRR